MISAINSYRNINFLGRRKQEPKEGFGIQRLKDSDIYVSRTQAESGAIHDVSMTAATAKKTIKRCQLLTTPNEDGGVTLENAKGEITELPRPLTVKEAQALTKTNSLYKDEKVKRFVEFIDSGVSLSTALKITDYTNKTGERIKTLITPDKEGQCTITAKSGEDIVLSRPLDVDEALFLTLAKNKKVSDENLQTFIDLKDVFDLSNAQAFELTHKPRLAARFYDLITPDEDGTLSLSDKEGNTVQLNRAFEPSEALLVLETENEKLPSYLAILDMGVEPAEAQNIISNALRLQRFLSLTKADDDGSVTLVNKNGDETVLQRALTPDEALIAMNERFTNQKIQEQLTQDGKVTSTKRRYNRLV